MAQTSTRERQEQHVAEERSFFEWVKLIAGVLAVGGLALFFLQNLQSAEIHFLWFDWELRVIWALVASALIGAVAALAFTTLRRRRRAPPPE